MQEYQKCVTASDSIIWYPKWHFSVTPDIGVSPEPTFYIIHQSVMRSVEDWTLLHPYLVYL